MKSDIEIAQSAELYHIKDIAKKLDIAEDDLELYGKYKAKLSGDFIDSLKDRPDGKLVLVTAINPTPAGEGKTTQTIGIGEALGRMNVRSVIALREPSLGPMLWHQGRSCRRRYGSGCPYGGSESPLHGRLSCDNYCQ